MAYKANTKLTIATGDGVKQFKAGEVIDIEINKAVLDVWLAIGHISKIKARVKKNG